MRLQQYITEDFNIKTWEMIRDMIERDCKPFIKELKGSQQLLLRGMKQSGTKDIFKKKVHKNRKPRMIPADLHERLGIYTKKKFGWNTREEGVFTSKVKFDASSWGQPFIIFPIGKIKYVWSNDVSKLYFGFDGWFKGIDVSGKSYKKYIDDENDQLWDEYIKPSVDDYKTSALNGYLRMSSSKQSECIIKCNEYYVIKYQFFDTLVEWFGNRYWK